MADAAAEVMTAVKAVQATLSLVTALQFTDFRYPPDCPLTDVSYYDYIIIGGGSAGSVLAYRLSANSSNKVLLLEAGPYPPMESEMAAMFTPMPLTSFDYATNSVNDNYTAQNLKESRVSLTAGKMLGGTSNINHMIQVQGDPHDFNNWASILGDDSWNYKNVLPYFKKAEKLCDSDLLDSSFRKLHGTDGMIKTARQISPVSAKYLEAFAEMGIETVDDVTSSSSILGATNPLFTIYDNLRQSGSTTYLAQAKDRSNLCLALSTTATKILIENDKATGVQVTTSSGETLKLYANKEVVVSAGAIHSPQLLMLSGIGPKSQLEDLGIPVVADLPVGENFMDHPSAVLVIQMEEGNASTAAVNPYAFPVPTTTAYAALDSSQTYPDYQTINLVFPPDSAAMLQLCSNCFKYTNDICNKFAAANKGRSVLFVVHNLMMPKSKGKITLASADPTDEPNVFTGTYTDNDDLVLMANALEDFARVLNTKYFRSVNANLVDIGLCTKGDWKCYALAMSGTMWHYAGTCSMGSVVDTELKVKGVKNLRVADASVMPTQVSGNINAAVTMIGERAAALMLGAKENEVRGNTNAERAAALITKTKENQPINAPKPKQNHGIGLNLNLFG